MAGRLFECLAIGDVLVHRLPEVAYHVKYKGKIKTDKKEADGSNDATTTVKGREVREVVITMSWPDRPDLNRAMGPILAKFDPAGPNGGKPFDYAHERNALDLAAIKVVRAILIESANGPDVEPGSGICTIEYECGSWVEPKNKTDAGKTPDEDQKKKFVQGSELPNNGAPNPAPEKPDVKP